MPRSELVQRLEIVVLAYNLELKGANQQFLVPAPAAAIFKSLDRDFIPEPERVELKELVTFATTDSYQGLEFYGLVRGANFALIAVAAVLVLSWSMGYVYAGMKGSLIKRLLVSLSTLLLWPIPVLAVWWNRRKSATSSPALPK